MKESIKIGLFGYGCVGQGLHHVLKNTKGIKAEIVKIAVKDPGKARELPEDFFTYNPDDILYNPAIDVIVELISDAEAAYHITTTALKNGKHVVSANKKMIAAHHEELVALQKEYGTALLYEASSCGSIPIIRTIEEYYDNELLNGIKGIFNGSSNYILSKIFNEGLDYATALKQAQEAGFAEADPILDVGGFDSLSKLSILTAHTFGVFVKPENVFNFGIQQLADEDVLFAKERGLKIKLIAAAERVSENTFTMYVMPQFVEEGSRLATIENEYNAVLVDASFSDQQVLIGKGAGGNPTGSAVLSDISALTYNYKYEYKKSAQNDGLSYTTKVYKDLFIRFKDEKALQGLQIQPGYKLYSEGEWNYFIGNIELESLLTLKDTIAKQEMFIVNGSKLLIDKIEDVNVRQKEKVLF